jgi:ATP-dependent helicase/nuclease subunit B
MGLRLVMGRAGSGKSELCLREIAAELEARPDGYPLIYIVPEQATFQAEYALATKYGLKGMLRAQVLSFRRLAWKLMQEVGGGKRLFIDDTGKSMVLRRALEKRRKELKVFRPAGEQGGALDNLVQLYNELKRSCIEISGLREAFRNHLAAGEGLPSLFKGKMSDLLLLLEEAESQLAGKYLDAEDYLTLLALEMPASAFLKGAEVWVDGFYGFTAQEYQVLEGLFKLCERVTVTACLDRDCLPGEKLDELDPFYPAALTCQNLQQRALSRSVSVEKVILNGGTPPRFKDSPDLAHLERELQHYPVEPYKGSVAALWLAAAVNRRCEVESLAREIIALVRDGGHRWRDMAVITGSLDAYCDIISGVFGDYEIPFFLDQKRRVIHHPLVEFIRSSLEVVNRNWRYEAVFRCIKSEFLFPLVKDEGQRLKWRERADRLENYVLAFGIRGAAWLREEPWEFRLRDTLEEAGEEEEKITAGEEAFLRLINDTRLKLCRPLFRFQESYKAARTVEERTAALYWLLTEVGAAERLELWSREALEKGDPEKAREHLQVYKGILELMDQLVELMGKEQVSAALYTGIVEAGLEALRLSLVPPSLDQVFVGDVERSRPGEARFVFILGANDGMLPSRSRDDGFLSEEERDVVSGWGLEIAPGRRRRLLDEQFLLYMALTRASRGLRVSYSLADEEGRALVPSLLVSHLQELFPALREELLAAEPGEESAAGAGECGGAGVDAKVKAEKLLQYIAHPRRALSHLAVQLSRWKKEEEIHPLWWDVYNWYAGEEAWRRLAGHLLGGLFYDNREEPLALETSRQLYGKKLRAGVSRLEQFRSCPFSHFISYGLRLRERQIYRLELPDIGRFFHAALRNFAATLQEKGLEWGELNRESCLQLAAEEVERLVPRLQREILLSSSRYRYLGEKMKETVGRAVLALGEQARHSSFKVAGLELSFGPEELLPGLVIELENGCRLELAGRIDRVDLARDREGRAYLRVIDYKSGRTELKIPEVYYGLSLQMLVYLDVLLAGAYAWLQETALPAGMLYFRVHTPVVNASPGRLPDPAEVEKMMRRRFKMKGLVLEDREIVRMMDGSLQKGQSEIIPVGLTADGRFHKNSAIITKERLELLRRHVRRLIEETAGEITGGQVEIRPYRLGKSNACRYCPYKAICQFDTSLEGNSYRVLKSEKAERIWYYLEKNREGEGGGEDGEQ